METGVGWAGLVHDPDGALHGLQLSSRPWWRAFSTNLHRGLCPRLRPPAHPRAPPPRSGPEASRQRRPCSRWSAAAGLRAGWARRTAPRARSAPATATASDASRPAPAPRNAGSTCFRARPARGSFLLPQFAPAALFGEKGVAPSSTTGRRRPACLPGGTGGSHALEAARGRRPARRAIHAFRRVPLVPNTGPSPSRFDCWDAVWPQPARHDEDFPRCDEVEKLAAALDRSADLAGAHDGSAPKFPRAARSKTSPPWSFTAGCLPMSINDTHADICSSEPGGRRPTPRWLPPARGHHQPAPDPTPRRASPGRPHPVLVPDGP